VNWFTSGIILQSIAKSWVNKDKQFYKLEARDLRNNVRTLMIENSDIKNNVDKKFPILSSLRLEDILNISLTNVTILYNTRF